MREARDPMNDPRDGEQMPTEDDELLREPDPEVPQYIRYGGETSGEQHAREDAVRPEGEVAREESGTAGSDGLDLGAGKPPVQNGRP